MKFLKISTLSLSLLSLPLSELQSKTKLKHCSLTSRTVSVGIISDRRFENPVSHRTDSHDSSPLTLSPAAAHSSSHSSLSPCSLTTSE